MKSISHIWDLDIRFTIWIDAIPSGYKGQNTAIYVIISSLLKHLWWQVETCGEVWEKRFYKCREIIWQFWTFLVQFMYQGTALHNFPFLFFFFFFNVDVTRLAYCFAFVVSDLIDLEIFSNCISSGILFSPFSWKDEWKSVLTFPILYFHGIRAKSEPINIKHYGLDIVGLGSGTQ